MVSARRSRRTFRGEEESVLAEDLFQGFQSGEGGVQDGFNAHDKTGK